MAQLSTGMDVEAVRGLARKLKSLGMEVTELSASIGAASDRMQSVWRGPDVERFIDGWHRTTRPNLQRVGEDIMGLAQSAKNNADEQERASSGGGLHSAGGSASVSGGAPTHTRDLLNQFNTGTRNTEDGLRIQYGVGADGRPKIIVSIGGTGSDGRMTGADNILAAYGVSRMSGYVREQLRELELKTGISLSESDLLFVGYSQGGMVAEDLAREGGYHSALVVTEAAPRLAGSNEGVDVLRLNSSSAANDAMEIPGKLIEGQRAVLDPLSLLRNTGVERTFGAPSRSDIHSPRASVPVPEPSPMPNLAMNPGGALMFNAVMDGVGKMSDHAENGVTDHKDHAIYGDAADSFDRSADPRDVAMRRRISSFQGIDYKYDSDS